MASYQYLFANTNDGKVNPTILQQTVVASLPTLTYINTDSTATTIDIFFSGALTVPQQATLTGFVNAHIGATELPLINLTTTGSNNTTATINVAQTANRTITLPDATDTLVGRATTDTLTNKSLVNANCFYVDGTDNTKKIGFQTSGATGSSTLTIASAQTANRTITLPDATDTLVGKATTDTLTNKTLTLSNIAVSAIPSAPASGVSLYSQLKVQNMVSQVGVNGEAYSFQPYIADRNIGWWSARGNSSAVSAIGLGSNVIGSTRNRDVVSANAFTNSRRLGFVSRSSASSVAGLYHGALQFQNIVYVVRFGTTTAISTQRVFVGLTANAIPSTQYNPTYQDGCIGFGANSTDTSFSFIHSPILGDAVTPYITQFTGTGSASGGVLTVSAVLGTIEIGMYVNTAAYNFTFGTRITAQLTGSAGDIGTYSITSFIPTGSVGLVFGEAEKNALTGTFPSKDTDKLYEARISRQTGIVYYSLEQGNQFFSSSTTTNIPVASALLSPAIWISNGTTASSVGIDIISQYIEML